mmetsp:Transcript_11911/g.14188  ORF Transcript_11911/g.14188 Transcript_11911/m.14188 type:complete len:426 (+) Transcript_11911:677-1954(+)|eukprot:CAMPEP_0197847724 /NCGR_PEP_ID=MMETSP1438-20131217/6907_1 /TAXON_ID=1461541 /ORGANISM="Pterosperma sp., Strain CCMP1384" /LENGTH=425 /DNA_ID=CAMNT_0043459729 /DNA_START=671 /DNA_END=1948 /DNA_ORIENTATION=+
MLKIKKVPTVVSLQQLDQPSSDEPSKKPGLLNSEGLIGHKMPQFRCPVNSAGRSIRRNFSVDDLSVVPKFDSGSSSGSDSDSEGNRATWTDDDEGLAPKSLFDTVCLSEWEDRADKGLFRYDVTACSTRIIPGKLGILAQLNEGRAQKKRPTEFRVDQVCQAFDESKFNFKKAAQNEALFQFGVSSNIKGSQFDDIAEIPEDVSLVVINVSPIEYGHILLVPKVLHSLPQRITHGTLNLAAEMCAASNNAYFRVGYNSLGAYATINHLHFQAYYLMAPFPVELANTRALPIRKRKRVDVTCVDGYPVRGLVFTAEQSREIMSNAVADACVTLQEMNVPFNLLIVDGGNRIFLFPQCFAEKQAKGLVPEHILDTQVNPASFEICGHLVLKRQEDYDNMTESFAEELLSQVSLNKRDFEDLCQTLFG